MSSPPPSEKKTTLEDLPKETLEQIFYSESSCIARETLCRTIPPFGNLCKQQRHNELCRFGKELGGVRSVACGAGHTLLLGRNGTVACIGYNESGQAPPEGIDGTFVAVSAGNRHSIALRSDGSIASWGENDHGELNIGKGSNEKLNDNTVWKEEFCKYEDASTTFTAIAAGREFSLALRDNGSIARCGAFWGGEDWKVNGPNPQEVFVQIAAGDHHTLALKSDRTIRAWGSRNLAVPPLGNDFVAIGAGYKYSVALRKNGQIEFWGDFESEIDREPWQSLNLAHPRSNVTINGTFVQIAAGFLHFLALSTDGTVSCFGSNRFGRAPPTGVPGRFVAIFAGQGRHSAGIREDGSVLFWGDNEYGQAPPENPSPGLVPGQRALVLT